MRTPIARSAGVVLARAKPVHDVVDQLAIAAAGVCAPRADGLRRGPRGPGRGESDKETVLAASEGAR
jgi:hypothetical protein